MAFPLFKCGHLGAIVFAGNVGRELSLRLLVGCGLCVFFVDGGAFEFVLQRFRAIVS